MSGIRLTRGHGRSLPKRASTPRIKPAFSCRKTLRPSTIILTMDTQNLHDVRVMQKMARQGQATVRPFLDFAPESGVREVPDPYFDGGFAGVYALIDAAADGLLKVLQEKITQEKTTQKMG